jgi:hypothetical protein
MKHAEDDTIIMLRQVGAFLVPMPSGRPVNELSSAHPRWRASSSRFLLVPVSSGYDQHRLLGTPPDQVRARSLHKTPTKNVHPSAIELGKKERREFSPVTPTTRSFLPNFLSFLIISTPDITGI